MQSFVRFVSLTLFSGELMMRTFGGTVAFAVGIFLAGAAYGESISGVVSTVTSSASNPIDLTTATDWAVYGINGVTGSKGNYSATPVVKSGVGSFGNITSTALTAHLENGPVYVTYSGGTGASNSSLNAGTTTNEGFYVGNGTSTYLSPSTFTITQTLQASSETLVVYLRTWYSRCDFTAALNGTTYYTNTDVLLPCGGSDGTGAGACYGALTLTVNGKVGETLSLSVSTNVTGVSNPNNWGNIVVAGATATFVPEPTSMALTISGVIGLIAFVWRKRHKGEL